jgi:hypothetical protein
VVTVSERHSHFLALVVTLLFSIPLCAYWGWIFSILWSYFVVPLGVPAIGSWHAAGLMLLVGLLKGSKPSETDPWKVLGYGILRVLVVGPLSLLFALLFRTWM